MVTKRENFEAIKNVLAAGGYEGLVKFVEHEVDLLDNKKGKVSKATLEKRATNEKLAEALYEVVDNEPARLNEIAERCEDTANLTTSKVAYIMGMLVKDGRVVKTYNGRNTMYARA